MLLLTRFSFIITKAIPKFGALYFNISVSSQFACAKLGRLLQLYNRKQ